METETLLIQSVEALKMEQSNHQKTRDRLAEVARKYLSTQYERDQLQNALNVVQKTIRENLPHLQHVTQQRDALMKDNEMLSSELTLLKTELRDTIKQNAKIKS
jgi:hypothetical protein